METPPLIDSHLKDLLASDSSISKYTYQAVIDRSGVGVGVGGGVAEMLTHMVRSSAAVTSSFTAILDNLGQH